jgi:CRP/FNR family transcriptional regulator, cyclic AMP receptor protein
VTDAVNDSASTPATMEGSTHGAGLVAQLSPKSRDTLLSSGSQRRYTSGAILFHQGDPSRHVVLIEEGWVKVSATTPRGWEALLAIRGPGDIVGELSAIDGHPRLATVTGLTRVTATVITSDRLHACLQGDSEIAIALLRYLAQRQRESDWRRMEHGASNGDSRLAARLVELVEQHGTTVAGGALIDLPLTQQDLAASVGVSREVVARTLRVLRERNVVVTKRRKIVVVRPDVLRSLAQSVSVSTFAP